MALAIIGSAGRSQKELFTRPLWEHMKKSISDVLAHPTFSGSALVSGGAAWADHLAVYAYLEGLTPELTLYLPAPFDTERNAFYQAQKYERSAASTANYYHELFKYATNQNSLQQIAQAIEKGATVVAEPHSLGYKALFARNRKIAQASDAVVAYTFCTVGGAAPSSSGTLNTWDQIQSTKKIHINLYDLINHERNVPTYYTSKPAMR